ncbi:hypothetical protein TSUD_144390 [Trifolium subterraneum]|uniref:SKI-interacting protein SKIP SNW domain-containing protein n=1 Tax=Trifolium subterraneum TaxID=3900 RepID=A0A2Z6MZM5_TRISU|nr:hypothetical protein TSUD_144390 [Trifolium subterraneum]
MGRNKSSNPKKIVYTQYKDLIPKILRNDEDADDNDAQQEIDETMQETEAALEKIVNVRLSARERLIIMIEMHSLKHKRVPKASCSPPVPVMHSPPRPVTVKDQQDWKLPPWLLVFRIGRILRVIPFLSRGLQEVEINELFAKLSKALYVAEHKAREAVLV